jgi:hypothetical protein
MNIKELAAEAGFLDADDKGVWITDGLWDKELTRFAELVVANIDPKSFMSYREGHEAGVAQTRARCIELVLAGSSMPVQTRTLEALQRDRKRIAKLIEEDGK